MEKAYVILRKGFEYDDNIYNETEGGTPDLIVFSKEDAKRKIEELNIKEYKESSLSDYSYDMENSLNVEYEVYQKFNESLITKYGKPEPKNIWDNNFEHKLHPMANEEESRKYASMVNIVFYEMIETDIDTQSLREKQLNTLLG